jgi:hypothetical protein
MRSTKRVFFVSAATILLASAATLGNTTAASADPCPSGAVCAYQDINWNGYPGPLYGNNEDLGAYYQWTSANSIYNNGKSCDVYIYSAMFYGGTRYPLARGTGWKNLNGKAIQEQALSNKWYNCS